MAVRNPLFWDGTDIVEMGSSTFDNITLWLIGAMAYYESQPVTLSVVASSGNLSSMTDTRKSAGAYATHTQRYPYESETAEPGTVTVTYDKVSQAVGSPTTAGDTSSKRFPVFALANGDIQSMSLTDMRDTFVKSAIDHIRLSSSAYEVTTSSTPGDDYELVSTTPIFTDTRADTAAYTSGGIPEALDQPTTVTNYYLHKQVMSKADITEIFDWDTSGAHAFKSEAPLYVDADDNLKQYSLSEWYDLMKELVIYDSVNLANYKLRYNINGSGVACGTGMTNTILNGSGNYQTRYVNTNDYRAQEFPNGSSGTAATHYLKIDKVA
jgi:hypothetical protein